MLNAFFVLQPPNTPKRPVAEDEGGDEDHEVDYEKQRKMRKIAKARAAELERFERERQLRLEKEREELTRQAEEEKQDAIMKLVESEQSEVR